jgi:glycosyltransferase involved in cell wall biosynthesis
MTFHKSRQVYIYTHTPIVPYGSGTQIRQFTTARAYRDLGMSVRVNQITTNSTDQNVILPDGIVYRHVQKENETAGCRQRIAYRIGFPFTDVLQVLYPDRKSILHLVLENELATPGAIHHFEYSSAANVAISLSSKKLNLIWSCHDWESDRIQKVTEMRRKAGYYKSESEKLRRQKYACKVEKRIAASCNLVLMIAEHETRIFREQLNIQNAELLPISWPDEKMPARTRHWLQGGILRMLHVGSPDAMVGYYSLKFILEEVFPIIPEHMRQMIEFWVLGKVENTSYSRSILKLAQPYPQVKFLGYVDDIQSLYAQCDIHLVGNSVATGIRTRIIESFVCGIPVLSVSPGAEGIVGLESGKNILLRDDPEGFAKQITLLFNDSSFLSNLSRAGRALYDQYYSRSVAAATLSSLLEKYIFT